MESMEQDDMVWKSLNCVWKPNEVDPPHVNLMKKSEITFPDGNISSVFLISIQAFHKLRLLFLGVFGCCIRISLGTISLAFTQIYNENLVK